MPTRTFAVAAAGVGAAVLAATAIAYTSTAGAAPASPTVHQAARPAHKAAPPAHQAAPPAHRAAPPVQRAAPAAAPAGSGSASGEKTEGRDREGGGRGQGHEDAGRIYFNEREYSATADGCITAASGLGSSSFSIFNDSRKTVEVYRGFTCDNGAPVATVGPHGDTNGVVTRTVHGGVFGDDGVVGSFRVIGDHDEW
ncbi:hypothetical protein [Streptomyces brasiliensis]|uniref:Lipoprotein n=1 Tax=Streptomyces brasiliensis TaxID=1954 RepID=A0A917L7V5_9ACTN|nr:hypothetical protein [Streptomyces brasiliensis]GGJ43890.1 hypothetical protein GCM10010121_063870 [Streptomyces brasiliensis]